MIRQNLGAFERVARLLIGLVLVAWVVTQPATGAVEAIALLAAACLLLNSVSGRCYLWRWLKLNSREPRPVERRSMSAPRH